MALQRQKKFEKKPSCGEGGGKSLSILSPRKKRAKKVKEQKAGPIT